MKVKLMGMGSKLADDFAMVKYPKTERPGRNIDAGHTDLFSRHRL